MEFSEFLEMLEKALNTNSSIVFFAHCNIRYSGRAEAYIPDGDRIIIIKADKVLLIHQPENGNPVNYLKAGAIINTEKKENHLLLRAQQAQDYLEVEIHRVYDAITRKLEDGQKQIIAGTEKDMSDMIKDNPQLIEPGFKPLSREEHTKYGFIDVFGYDKNNNLVIIECKRYTASLQAVTQLRRYVEKMKELRGIENVRGIIAAPSISANALEMLQRWGFEWKRVKPPKRLERYDKKQSSLNNFTRENKDYTS